MTDSYPAVNCPNHGIVKLTHPEYQAQLSKPDNLWTCPHCGETSQWAGVGNYE